MQRITWPQEAQVNWFSLSEEWFIHPAIVWTEKNVPLQWNEKIDKK